MEGFRDALLKAGIELPVEYLSLIPETQEDIYKATNDLLHLPTPPTAVFGALDVYALGVLKAARQIGVSVPQKLAIIGFDDLDMSNYADLTTIRQHLDESGRLAIEVLLAQIEDPFRPVQHIRLPLTLIERLTT
jgi:LacI family transcriptional regulator